MENTEFGGRAAGKVAKATAIIENAMNTGKRIVEISEKISSIKRAKIKVRSYHNYKLKKDKLALLRMQSLLLMFSSAAQHARILSQPIPRHDLKPGGIAAIGGQGPETIESFAARKERYVPITKDIINKLNNGNG